MNNVKRLPDCYSKQENSNNYKLFELHETALSDINQDVKALETMLDVNRAYGKTLDMYGEMVLQQRQNLDDIKYRYALLAKMGKNIVNADYNSILAAIVQMFGCKIAEISLDDIKVTETERACVLQLTKFPLHILTDAGFTSKQAVAMIETLLPVCVVLEAHEFEGTFEFSEKTLEYDEVAGFADDNRKIGGYFGLLLGEDDAERGSYEI